MERQEILNRLQQKFFMAGQAEAIASEVEQILADYISDKTFITDEDHIEVADLCGEDRNEIMREVFPEPLRFPVDALFTIDGETLASFEQSSFEAGVESGVDRALMTVYSYALGETDPENPKEAKLIQDREMELKAIEGQFFEKYLESTVQPIEALAIPSREEIVESLAKMVDAVADKQSSGAKRNMAEDIALLLRQQKIQEEDAADPMASA